MGQRAEVGPAVRKKCPFGKGSDGGAADDPIGRGGDGVELMTPQEKVRLVGAFTETTGEQNKQGRRGRHLLSAGPNLTVMTKRKTQLQRHQTEKPQDGRSQTTPQHFHLRTHV